MSQFISDNVNGKAVKVEIWEQVNWNTKYAGQVSCPDPNCETFYTSQHHTSPNNAKSAVMKRLREHYKKKHS